MLCNARGGQPGKKKRGTKTAYRWRGKKRENVQRGRH